MSFWADKLNGNTPAPVVPKRDLFTMFEPISTQPIAPQPQSIPEYTPSKPMVKGSICGGCGADTILNTPAGLTSCGTCGWHPRFQHSTYGLNAPTDRSNKNVTPTRQNDSALPLSASIALLNSGGGSHITSL